jgi:hypothetical protein
MGSNPSPVNDNGEHVVASLSVPAGDYAVTGHVTFTNNAASNAAVQCTLDDGRATNDLAQLFDVGRQTFTAAVNYYSNMTLTGPAVESSPATFFVTCQSLVLAQSVSAYGEITAIAADAVN